MYYLDMWKSGRRAIWCKINVKSNMCIHLDPSTWLMGISGYVGKWFQQHLVQVEQQSVSMKAKGVLT